MRELSTRAWRDRELSHTGSAPRVGCLALISRVYNYNLNRTCVLCVCMCAPTALCARAVSAAPAACGFCASLLGRPRPRHAALFFAEVREHPPLSMPIPICAPCVLCAHAVWGRLRSGGKLLLLLRCLLRTVCRRVLPYLKKL